MIDLLIWTNNNGLKYACIRQLQHCRHVVNGIFLKGWVMNTWCTTISVIKLRHNADFINIIWSSDSSLGQNLAQIIFWHIWPKNNRQRNWITLHQSVRPFALNNFESFGWN